MKGLIFFIVVLTLFQAGQVATAEDGFYPVDASKFDVAGVKLGMSKKEAITALTKKLGIKASQLDHKKYRNHQIISFRLGRKDFYSVSLKANIYEETLDLIVTRVSFTTTKDTKTFQDAVISKYGKHSSERFGKLQWCKKRHKDVYPYCDAEQRAVLVLGKILSENSVKLEDHAWLPVLRKKLKEKAKREKAVEKESVF